MNTLPAVAATPRFPWRVFWTLVAAAVLAVLAFVPYALARGLEAAMLAHFTADFVMHAVRVTFVKG